MNKMIKQIEQIQPKFIWFIHVCIIVLFGLLFKKLSLSAFSDGRPKAANGCLLIGSIFLLIVLIIFILKYFSYKKTVFNFNTNSVKYERDFITLSQKNIKYKDIKEVTLHRGIIQKLFGLGTIEVISQATAQDAGIKIYNITNYQEVYDFLMEKIKD